MSPSPPSSKSRLLRQFLPASVLENRFSRIALWLLPTGVAAILLLGGGIHVLISNMKDVQRQEVATHDRELIARRYDRLLKDLRETTEGRKLLQEIRPTRGNLVAFIRRLEAAAAEARVAQTIDAFPEGKDPHGQPYATPVLRYEVTVEGPLDAVIGYLHRVHTMQGLVRVESLNITTDADGDVLAHAIAKALLAVAVRE